MQKYNKFTENANYLSVKINIQVNFIFPVMLRNHN